MSKAQVIVLSVVHQGLTKAETARKFDVSWQWVHTLVTRYQTGGLDALEPRSRRPHASPATTERAVGARVLGLREELTAAGLDAGPVTIGWHLAREHLPVPAGGPYSLDRPVNVSGDILIEPYKNYWRDQNEKPDRWPTA